MDERAIKRLLIIVVASIIAIMLLKMVLTKTYTALNKATAEKKQTVAAKPADPQPEPISPVTTGVIEAPLASAVGEIPSLNTYASSAVSEAR